MHSTTEKIMRIPTSVIPTSVVSPSRVLSPAGLCLLLLLLLFLQQEENQFLLVESLAPPPVATTRFSGIGHNRILHDHAHYRYDDPRTTRNIDSCKSRVIVYASPLSSSSSSSSSKIASTDNKQAADSSRDSIANDNAMIASLQERIEDCIQQKQDPEIWIRQLEEYNTYEQPNRISEFKGEWHVWYTDCPPPSNGQLGPFQGTASQVIDDSSSNSRSYQNLLRVPPNDWLTATLDGVWEEWDGTLLMDSNERSKEAVQDWGAKHWKVTFLQLQIAVLGFPIVTKKFDANTSRVWRTTYLDDEIRVVRAGKTGRIEDEVVFYTKRTKPPPSLPLWDASKK